jgi:DNA-binding XRE family transcriptional regulator
LFRPFRARVSVGVPLTQAVGLGFVRSPLWGSPAHTWRLSLTAFWSAAREEGAPPREGQNLERWPQKFGNIVPVPVSPAHRGIWRAANGTTLIVCRRIAFCHVLSRYSPMRSKDTDPRARFGTAVRRLRRRKGISQEKLAELAGIHRTYMGDVERGTRNLALVNMTRIANALGLPLSELIREMERR